LYNRFVLITGCSDGGKSTLLAELHARGHRVVEGPVRRTVRRELETGSSALPWIDASAFIHCVMSTALADRKKDGGNTFRMGVL